LEPTDAAAATSEPDSDFSLQDASVEIEATGKVHRLEGRQGGDWKFGTVSKFLGAEQLRIRSRGRSRYLDRRPFRAYVQWSRLVLVKALANRTQRAVHRLTPCRSPKVSGLPIRSISGRLDMYWVTGSTHLGVSLKGDFVLSLFTWELAELL